MLGASVFGVLAKNTCTLPPVSGGKADINQVVRHKSLICAAENPVLQDFQPITALRAVIEYALFILGSIAKSTILQCSAILLPSGGKAARAAVHTALAKSLTLPPPLAALQTTLLFAIEGSIYDHLK